MPFALDIHGQHVVKPKHLRQLGSCDVVSIGCILDAVPIGFILSVGVLRRGVMGDHAVAERKPPGMASTPGLPAAHYLRIEKKLPYLFSSERGIVCGKT